VIQGSRRFRPLYELGDNPLCSDEQHDIAGDTELLGKRLTAGIEGGWFQPPAKGEVAHQPEKLALQRLA
jgi:hypothetical protein